MCFLQVEKYRVFYSLNCFLFVEKYIDNFRFRFKEAETDCTTALQLDPEYVKAYHRRGLALKELNQLKEALENFQKALDLDPKNACINKDFMKLEKRMNETNLLKVILHYLLKIIIKIRTNACSNFSWILKLTSNIRI